jgi:hypothetical protein
MDILTIGLRRVLNGKIPTGSVVLPGRIFRDVG